MPTVSKGTCKGCSTRAPEDTLRLYHDGDSARGVYCLDCFPKRGTAALGEAKPLPPEPSHNGAHDRAEEKKPVAGKKPGIWDRIATMVQRLRSEEGVTA